MKPGEKIEGIEWLTLEQAKTRWPFSDDPSKYECHHDTSDPKCTLTSDGYCLMCGEMH
jgi:hypothetical protein